MEEIIEVERKRNEQKFQRKENRMFTDPLQGKVDIRRKES